MTEINSTTDSVVRPTYTPMQIARHRLFTTKEKIDLLNKIKDAIRGARFSETELGFTPSDVDDAIEDVRLGALNGERVETVVWGTN